MKILVVIPALDLEVNDIGQALLWIAQHGHDVVCLGARRNPSKSSRPSPLRSTEGDLTILRPWPNYNFAAEQPELAAMLAAVVTRKDSFDIVLCVQPFNFPVVRALLALQDRGTPVAVLFEEGRRVVSDDTESKRLRLAHGARMMPRGADFGRWVASEADAVITCDPGDSTHLSELRELNPKTEFVPWCTDPGCRRTNERGLKSTAVFAGALTPNKNPLDLLDSVRRLIDARVLERFSLVTSPMASPDLAAWQSLLGHQLSISTNLSLVEVASVIASAGLGITAASRGGWGFIGNCWAMRTPIVLLRPNPFVEEIGSVLPAWEFPGVVRAVQSLIEDETLSRRIVEWGYSNFERNHSAEKVGQRLLRVFQSVS